MNEKSTYSDATPKEIEYAILSTELIKKKTQLLEAELKVKTLKQKIVIIHKKMLKLK